MSEWGVSLECRVLVITCVFWIKDTAVNLDTPLRGPCVAFSSPNVPGFLAHVAALLAPDILIAHIRKRMIHNQQPAQMRLVQGSSTRAFMLVEILHPKAASSDERSKPA